MAIFLPVTSAGYSRPWTKEQIVARGIQKRKFAAQQKARLMAPENKTKFNEANPGLIDALRELTSWNSFAASLVEQFDDRGSLSDKQTGAAVAMLMKVKANKANRAEAPSVDLGNVVAMVAKQAPVRAVVVSLLYTQASSVASDQYVQKGSDYERGKKTWLPL